jgi:hypothetical protein
LQRGVSWPLLLRKPAIASYIHVLLLQNGHHGREKIKDRREEDGAELEQQQTDGELQGGLTSSIVGRFIETSSGYRMEFFEEASCYISGCNLWTRPHQILVRLSVCGPKKRLSTPDCADETGENYTNMNL